MFFPIENKEGIRYNFGNEFESFKMYLSNKSSVVKSILNNN
jgi:hypothetical protein